MTAEKVGFLTMGAAPLVGDLPEVGVGMLDYAFMGKAHSNAYKKMPYMMYPPPAIPRLVAICGRNAEGVRAAARRYGYETAYTDWREMLQNGRIQLPAIRQARELIHNGDLGEIYHFRASYLQEWIADPSFPRVWRLDRETAGSGALGDLGSHIIDLARFLVGELRTVSGMTKTFVTDRPLLDEGGRGRVEVDDAFAAVVEFANGAVGTLEASRFAPGRKNHQVLEVNGSQGSLRFDLERLNELEVFWAQEAPRETRGFHRVLVTETYHPFWEHWWPHGSIIGWEHTFVHEVHHLLDAIVNNKSVAPYGATFEDGYRAAVIGDAILESARTGRRVAIPA